MLEDCNKPSVLPEDGLTASQVEYFWLFDRASLLSCDAAKKAVQDYYSTRDIALSGNSGNGR